MIPIDSSILYKFGVKEQDDKLQEALEKACIQTQKLLWALNIGRNSESEIIWALDTGWHSRLEVKGRLLLINSN